MNLLKEIEKDPFDPDEFVEKLVRHTIQVQDSVSKNLDIGLLHETFTKVISELEGLLEGQQRKCELLELDYKDIEIKDLQRLAVLEDQNKNALMMFHELDERINYVAAKVIHLGDQLESVDTPRSKVVEAQKLMYYFDDLRNPGPFLDEIFTDSSRIVEAAQLMLKLNSIAIELPDEKFAAAKKSILTKYDEVERKLMEEFYLAHERNDTVSMKEAARILVHFKGYGQCVDAFIEHSQSAVFANLDIFKEAIPLCERNYKLVKFVFPNPEQVMGKFVLNLFSMKLQESARKKLSDRSNMGKYLQTLHDLFTITVDTANAISHFDMGNDETYLQKLTFRLFQPHLDEYIRTEVEYLKNRYTTVLDQYYESKNHQKKQLNDTNRFLDLRRDLQAVIGTRTNFNMSQAETIDSDTLISEDIANAMFQESKMCFQRCGVLSKPEDVSSNAVQLLEVVLQHLLVDHVDYAIELGLQSIPISDSKVFPSTHFFQIIQITNKIVLELKLLLTDSVVPLVSGSPECAKCILKERSVLEMVESKLDAGIDRILNAIISWVKLNLQAGQKRMDVKPCSASHIVVNKIRNVTETIRENLDSINGEVIIKELGIRLHRVIVENLFQYQFNTSEAYNVYIEVTEYKRCAEEMEIALVTTLFETLQALWKILMVPPENLKQVCNDSQLTDVDENVISNFMQLRRDSKKTSHFLKGV